MIFLNIFCLFGLLLAVIAAVYAFYALFLFICGLFVDNKREYDDHSRFYRALLNGVTGIIIKTARIRIHTSGTENIPQNTRNLLFVSNHRSNFDPLITWYMFKKWRIAFVSKAANLKLPIFGRIIRRCCFMEIDRENPRNAMKTIQKAAGLLQKGEMSVGIYPEGTRSKECRLLPFHAGVFKIAQKADASIVVLAVSGTEGIHKNYPFHHTDVCLDVLDIIPANEIKGVKTDVLEKRVREIMEQRLNGEPISDPCNSAV